jgi:hypothetical protein
MVSSERLIKPYVSMVSNSMVSKRGKLNHTSAWCQKRQIKPCVSVVSNKRYFELSIPYVIMVSIEG